MELYLYDIIIDETTEKVVSGIEEAMATDEEVTMRLNSPGGLVFDGWGIAAKMMESTVSTTIKIDGIAASMGAVVLPFADRVEALDVSQIMIHRATGPGDDEEATEAQKDLSRKVNTNMRKALEQKVDSAKFEEITGYKLKDVFDPNKERVDVWMTARQAKQIGIVDKVNKLSAEYIQNYQSSISQYKQMVAQANNNPNSSSMEITAENIKEHYPQIAQQLKDEGKQEGEQAGSEKEKDRIGALLEFYDADPALISQKIDNGETLSQKEQAKLQKKQLAIEQAKGLEDESPEDVAPAQTGEGTKNQSMSAEEKEQQEFMRQVDSTLGINEKQ